MQVFENSSSDVFNVGSEEQVSINQMIEVIENIADYKVNKIYLRDKPLGVRGRSSDNTFIQKKIGWCPKLNLSQGLEKTYAWIFNQITNPINTEKFTRSY